MRAQKKLIQTSAGVLAAALVLGWITALERQVRGLRQELADAADDRSRLTAQLSRIEEMRAKLRGFGLDYHGRDNLRLLEENPAGRRLVFYGDSLIEFWDVQKAVGGLGFLPINRGVRGQVTEFMLGRFYFDAVQLKPWGIVVLGGTNDALRLGSEAAAEQNLDILVYAATRKGARVFLGTIPPLDLPSTDGKRDPKRREIAALAAKVNGWIRRRCAGGTCTLVDFEQAMRQAQEKSREPLFRDYAHPNSSGYSVMARALRAALAAKGS